MSNKAITTPQDMVTMQALQAAENALSMALHYLRASASNIPDATRKAVQALAALNTLQEATTAGVREPASGRAPS